MKKFVNDPEQAVDEMLEGYLAAHGDRVRLLDESRVLAKRNAPIEGKVGLVTGGGSGHKPAFIGYIGEGLMDAVAVGDIFASPSAKQIYDAIKAVDGGKGVLCVLGNYSGDVMNFDMAADMAADEGIEVQQVVGSDDVGSAPKDEREDRRGVAGEVVIWKMAGAKAAKGGDLDEVKEVAEKANFNSRSMGVAHSPCTVPTAGEPTFKLGEDEMEIGVGHHGEPGVEKTKMKSADETVDILMGKILKDLPFQPGDQVLVLINGLGATPLLEQYIIERRVNQILKEENIEAYKTIVGDYFTSLEMAGFSITLTKLDEELKELVDVPAVSPLANFVS